MNSEERPEVGKGVGAGPSVSIRRPFYKATKSSFLRDSSGKTGMGFIISVLLILVVVYGIYGFKYYYERKERHAETMAGAPGHGEEGNGGDNGGHQMRQKSLGELRTYVIMGSSHILAYNADSFAWRECRFTLSGSPNNETYSLTLGQVEPEKSAKMALSDFRNAQGERYGSSAAIPDKFKISCGVEGKTLEWRGEWDGDYGGFL